MTTVLFSLAPALHATRVDVAGRLAQGGRGMIAGRMGLQRVLVASQVALAVVLLTAAGLVVRSFDRLQRVSPGFSAANVLAFRISAQWSERPAAVAARQLRTLERLRAVPGVTAAAFSSVLPAGATFTPEEISIVGQPARKGRPRRTPRGQRRLLPGARRAGAPGCVVPGGSEPAAIRRRCSSTAPSRNASSTTRARSGTSSPAPPSGSTAAGGDHRRRRRRARARPGVGGRADDVLLRADAVLARSPLSRPRR